MSAPEFDSIPRARQSEILALLTPDRGNPPEVLKILAQGGKEADFLRTVLNAKWRRNKRAVVVQTMVPH
jgi:hypothetical protein